MDTTSAGICWPSRYLLKWLFIFFAFLVLGLVIAALMPRSERLTQAYILVVNRQGEPIRAIVYLAASKDEMKPSKSFPVEPRLTPRTQGAGNPIDFMVQPVDEQNNPTGEPERWRVNWPRKEGETLRYEYRGVGRGSSLSAPSRPGRHLGRIRSV